MGETVVEKAILKIENQNIEIPFISPTERTQGDSGPKLFSRTERRVSVPKFIPLRAYNEPAPIANSDAKDRKKKRRFFIVHLVSSHKKKQFKSYNTLFQVICHRQEC